jgi:hypothetical protein
MQLTIKDLHRITLWHNKDPADCGGDVHAQQYFQCFWYYMVISVFDVNPAVVVDAANMRLFFTLWLSRIAAVRQDR